MPVPKKRLTRSRQGHRRSQWKAFAPTLTTCTNCGSSILTHTVCNNCGHYRGRLISKRLDALGLSDEA
jgi:large subunit ribosomal protein L32